MSAPRGNTSTRKTGDGINFSRSSRSVGVHCVGGDDLIRGSRAGNSISGDSWQIDGAGIAEIVKIVGGANLSKGDFFFT